MERIVINNVYVMIELELKSDTRRITVCRADGMIFKASLCVVLDIDSYVHIQYSYVSVDVDSESVSNLNDYVEIY